MYRIFKFTHCIKENAGAVGKYLSELDFVSEVISRRADAMRDFVKQAEKMLEK